ncbi:MAG: OPT/YSL family transporter, partial [Gemmatimonadales bacterium]|nr:OPT/YSL family transporter [Gemmatimonadales bacterium]
GVLSWLVIIPLIKFFGLHIPTPIFPGTIPIGDMAPNQIWNAYIRSIGAGAVTTAGLITLGRTLPTIIDSLRAGLKDFTDSRSGKQVARLRTEDDLPITIVVGGSTVLMLVIWALLSISINPGHTLANGFASVLIVVFGFLFVTVSSRITGLIGNSSNPISGMTIATLMATCLIFVAIGWTGGVWAAVALSVGAVVCIAAAVAGATSQDLKTGFLIGATPWRQQLSLIVGCLASVLVIGYTLTYLNKTYTRQEARVIENVTVTAEMKDMGSVDFNGRSYHLLNVLGSRTIPDGRYYFDPSARRIEFQELPGIGSPDMPAPQATLMTTVINGILNRNLQWGLVLFGVFIVVVLELCGVRSLAFAVGSYLPISTTAPIFAGGVVRWLVERKTGTAKAGEGEVSSGSLTAAGLIAGGAIAGLLLVGPMDASRTAQAAAAQRAGQAIAPDAVLYDMGARWWPD